MIDQAAFKIEWRIICERFSRDPSTALEARYYQSLSPLMSTAEFRLAARQVLHECEFFPPPARFVEAVRGDPELAAMDAWDVCQSVMCGSRSADTLDTITGKVVQLMGGEMMLRRTKLTDVAFRRKEFMRLYRLVADGHMRQEAQEALAPWTEEGREIMGDLQKRVEAGDAE